MQDEYYVPRSLGCPHCGERRHEKLVWCDEDSDFACCQTCKHEYKPIDNMRRDGLCANSKTT